MARVETRRLVVQDASVRNLLQAASADSGDRYEKALGGCIARRAIPILDMIGEETGIPVAQVSVLKTRGPRSSQSLAVFQWQRGHRHGPDKRWPDATIEIVGARGVINAVYALEISLQTDITRVGGSPRCRMSMGKASQLAMTAAVFAAKPAYAGAEIRYWYLCPWEPISGVAKRRSGAPAEHERDRQGRALLVRRGARRLIHRETL